MPFPKPAGDSEHTLYSDFPIGTHVKVVSDYVDSYFWFGETGVVIRNNGKYLGIIIQLDKPREFTDGYIQKEFNFEPENLELAEDARP